MRRTALAIALAVVAAAEVLLVKAAFLRGWLFAGERPHAQLFSQPTDMYSSLPEVLVASVSAVLGVLLVEIAKFMLLGSGSRMKQVAVLTAFQALLLHEAFRYNVPDWYAWVGSFLLGREHIAQLGPRSPLWTISVVVIVAVAITLFGRERHGIE